MSLPTSQDLAGLTDVLQAQAIARKIAKQRPDLTRVIEASETRPMVRLYLPEGGCVVIARVTVGLSAFWAIVTPDDPKEPTPQHRTTDHLALAAAAAYDQLVSPTDN